MMIEAVAAGVSGLALVAALLCLALGRRAAVRHRRDLAELRGSLEMALAACSLAIEEVKKEMAGRQTEAAAAPEPPRPGSLNRSARAEALKLLRSGMPAQAVGSATGMTSREVRLLERVAGTFCL
jgi:hypothetical protein